MQNTANRLDWVDSPESKATIQALPAWPLAVMGFFAILNPLANTPVFLGPTADEGAATRRGIARQSLLIAFLIVMVFSIMGNLIFERFGIALFAFRVTGGILVFKIGYNTLHGEPSRVHEASDTSAPPVNDANRAEPLSIAVVGIQMFIDGVHGSVLHCQMTG